MTGKQKGKSGLSKEVEVGLRQQARARRRAVAEEPVYEEVVLAGVEGALMSGAETFHSKYTEH